MMKSLITLGLAVAGTVHAAALNARAACNADNCFRAISRRLPGASSECVSFASTTIRTLITVTPMPVVTTTQFATTSTTTFYSVVGGSVITPGPNPPPYQVAQGGESTVPPYASACGGAPRYLSACSCIGVTSPVATVTLTTTASPTTTVYTSTRTAIATSGVCDAAKSYGVQYGFNNQYTPVGTTQKYYVYVPAANGLECCTKCFASKGCDLFEYFTLPDGTPSCSFYTPVDGPVVDSGNAKCPYGITGLGYDSIGNYHGIGPCGRAI